MLYLIGTDRTVCNWGGGNTSFKTRAVDFKGNDVEVMWVKGSGSDLATMNKEDFSALVLQGSAIWGSNWRKERASAYGIDEQQLEEHYRQRTVLKENIYPRDIAEAIAFFASSKAKKTTGCMLTVDGGVAAAFAR